MSYLLKYTKNCDNFMVNILPYLEIYVSEYPSVLLEIYSNDMVCNIINVMFGEHILTHISKQNFCLFGTELIELDIFLAKYYDLTQRKRLSKPINSLAHSYLTSKDIICIYPKYKKSEPYHNINNIMLDTLVSSCKFDNANMYIIGNQLDKLNCRFGKNIDNFIDIISYLKYCKLFITSESCWHYISLLCNCRNVIVYASNYCQDGSVLSLVSKNDNDMISFDPFNANVYITNDLTCDKTTTLIRSIMMQ